MADKINIIFNKTITSSQNTLIKYNIQDDIDALLGEAYTYTATNTVRYTAEEVFDRVRARIPRK